MSAELLAAWGIVIFAGAVYFALLVYLCVQWLRCPAEKITDTTPVTGISVIIPARNESTSITACLEALSRQNFPHNLFEVILVDDHSGDDTVARAAAFQQQLPLTIISLNNADGQGKKAALTKGIAAARFELLVTTDADTFAGADWLKTIASCYERTQARMIIAPVLYEASGFFGSLQALEIAGLALVTGASAAAGKPMLANGANLAYTRTVFRETGGFSGDGYASGDDVLLLQRVLEKYPGGVHFLKSPAAVVYTRPLRSLNAFFNQRKRWASKFRAFRMPLLKYTAFTVFLVNLLILLFGAGICFSATLIGPFVALVALKIVIDFLLLSLAASFFRRTDLLLVFFAALPLYSFYVVVTAAGALGGHFTWKGRTNSTRPQKPV